MTHKRNLRTSIINGWKKKCPSCGKTQLFKNYLNVEPKCKVCGLNLYLQKADDGPAYLTILLVGHIIAPLLILTYENFNPSPVLVALSFSVVFIILSLFLLPRLKGVVIGIQWAKEMHGFNSGTDQNVETRN